MSTKQEVWQFLTDYFRTAPEKEIQKGITAQQVAEGLGIWQNDASAALNALCAAHSLIREGSRPIRYFLPDAKSSAEKSTPVQDELPAFERIIGANGSLALQIQLAKAGASYPPNGMHMLIIGESGVGKTLLAGEIWRYMNQNRPEGTPEKPLVVFNCAEYAENPQLLLSQLFGYVKGAFTGADTSHGGLVQKADGGILFLDEIHRLPATGQEMLFTLLDRGIYRSLGSTKDQTVRLMVIGATTEDPNAALLNTFRRRIPMVIELPPLQERPIKERVALIFHFIEAEAKRLNLPIQVSPHALRLLVMFQSEANIGDLKNEIQLCCARGYLDFLSKSEETPPFIDFIGNNLSRHMQNCEISDEAERYLTGWMERHSLVVSPDQNADPIEARTSTSDLYGFIEQRLGAYSSENLPPQEVGHLVSMDLYTELSDQSHTAPGEMESFASVTPGIQAAANELIRLAGNQFNYAYPDIICETLALFLQQIQFHSQVNQAYSIADIQPLARAVSEKMRFVRKMAPMLNHALNTTLTDSELTIISLLLDTHEEEEERKMVGLIVLGHGKSTASSIAEFSNQVLMTKIAHAVDIQIDLSPEEVVSQLCTLARQIDRGKGVIVLTDSDNFEYYEKHLHTDVGVDCRVVPGMSTVMALELCKSIITSDDDLDTIFYNYLASYQTYISETIRRTGMTQTLPAEPEDGKNVIITYCITGAGAARRIREYLLQFPAVYMNTEIMPIGLRENVHELAGRLGTRLKLIIGFIDPKIKGVPFISMENISSQEGINRITLLLKGWKSAELEAHWSYEDLPLHIRFSQIAQRISYFAPSLEPEAVTNQADFVVSEMRRLFPRELSDDLQVRIYIHAAAMFDRLNTEDVMPMPEDELGLVQNNSVLYHQLSEILEKACTALKLKLQPSELYYFLLALPLDEMQ